MLELPDGAEHEVPLELEDRKVLGAPSHPPELVPGRIALAEPQHRPLRSAEVPASLRPFLDSRLDSAFWLVRQPHPVISRCCHWSSMIACGLGDIASGPAGLTSDTVIMP